MSDRPNIILIMTDQQRYDSIGALGAFWMQTPNLDRLAREGVTLENCFCTAPSCVPSRASFFNLQYPHALKVYHNAHAWGRSWVERFQTAGYHTVSLGKMHTVPLDAPCGFDQRFVVENKDRPLRLDRPHGNFYDEWDRFLNHSGVRKPSRATYRAEHPDYEHALGAYAWPLAECYHPDRFVGTLAEWFIDQRRSMAPLFLQIGFPGPHPPYDPPSRVLDRYAQTTIPLPEVTESELAAQPRPHAAYRREMIRGGHDAVRWCRHPEPGQLLRLRRHYAANVTLIDEQIGRILHALEGRGYLDNSIVVFTSDHGDCLGDHGHIQKWTLYDAVTRVPALIRAPGRLPAGRTADGLLQQMDIATALFNLSGLEPPVQLRDRSAPGVGDPSSRPEVLAPLDVLEGKHPGRRVVFAEHSADNILKDVNFVTMVRTLEWKLVHYLDQPWGELYDLRHDPGETQNLWADPDRTQERRELLAVLRDWRIRESLPV